MRLRQVRLLPPEAFLAYNRCQSLFEPLHTSHKYSARRGNQTMTSVKHNADYFFVKKVTSPIATPAIS